MFKTQKIFVNESLNEVWSGYTKDSLSALLSELFDFNSEASRRFVNDTYWRCILGKVQQPSGEIPRRWITPGGETFFGAYPYNSQYIWDTLFMLEPLSRLPSTSDVIRECLQNFWQFQDEWKQIAPDYAHGFIRHTHTCNDFFPKAFEYHRNHSNAPWFAWGIKQIFNNNGDIKMVKEAIPRLCAYHDWFWRERAIDDNGLCVLGAYSDRLQSFLNETYDMTVDGDNMKLIEHPQRNNSLRHYSDRYNVAHTAYIIHAERCLAELATAVGDHITAATRSQYAEKATAAARTMMWDEEYGSFLSVNRDGSKHNAVSIGSWMMLMAGVPTTAQAERMIATLSSSRWMTVLPLPTTDRFSKEWEPAVTGFLPFPPKRTDHLRQAYNMWRGDVWPPCNYQVALGVKKYGFDDLAARICDATIMNAIQWDDVNERYCCDTGRPLGVQNYGMSAAVITMMTDQLSRMYQCKPKVETKN
jgi:glycogen debranching enzyme